MFTVATGKSFGQSGWVAKDEEGRVIGRRGTGAVGRRYLETMPCQQVALIQALYSGGVSPTSGVT